MAKTKLRLVIASACCGAISFAFLVASIATESWVTADISAPSSDDISTINYGLFGGTYNRKNIGTTQTYIIYPTCDYGEGICMWSCLDSADARFSELVKVHLQGTGSFDCKPYSTSTSAAYTLNLSTQANKLEDGFISNGLYVATFAHLVVSCTMNAIALILNIYNIFRNPTHTFLSLRYVPSFYSSAVASSLVVLILFGIQFGSNISKNVALLDTLVAHYTSNASLGWSFFIIIAALLLNLAALTLIIVRTKAIAREESDRTIKGDEVNNDANTFMY